MLTVLQIFSPHFGSYPHESFFPFFFCKLEKYQVLTALSFCLLLYIFSGTHQLS